MCLQEAIEMVPNPWNPVDDLHQLYVARPASDLRLDQLPPQVATQEAFHWLHVVGTQHPPDQRTNAGSSGLKNITWNDKMYLRPCKSFKHVRLESE